MINNPLQPGVYNLRHNSDTGYWLEYSRPRFEVYGKNYGHIDRHLSIFWTRFTDRGSSMGVMLTGAPGSGKTRMAELLGNKGISDGMCVVMITDVVIKPTIISFIESLSGFVVVLDEFAKNFDMKIQNKMLTMFSSVSMCRKFFVITENSRNQVSTYIRTRPGRIRYAVDYDRLSQEVLDEYCGDYRVTKDMQVEINDLYSRASKFTFDHLSAIVSEHLAMPECSLEDLLELLNLDDLASPPTWACRKAVFIKDPDLDVEVRQSSDAVTKAILDSNRRLGWLDLTVKEPTKDNPDAVKRLSVCPTGKSLKNIDGDVYTFTAEGYLLYYYREDD